MEFRENCGSARTLEDYSFEHITPEDIIGKGAEGWHLHVSFSGWSRVMCTGIHGDTEERAASEAISKALVRLADEVRAEVESYVALTYLSCLNREEYYCLHDPGESCLDGCALITVTRMK